LRVFAGLHAWMHHTVLCPRVTSAPTGPLGKVAPCNDEVDYNHLVGCATLERCQPKPYPHSGSR
jgi:hypothetical protein